MAEDIILRLKGEDVSASAVLRSVTAEAERLGVTVEQINQGAGSGAGPLAQMADEADILGFSIEQATRSTEGLGASVVRGFDFQTVKKFAGGIEEGAAATAKTTGLLGKANSALLGVNVTAGKLGSIISKISPEVGFLVSKFGALAVPITAVVGSVKLFSAAIDQIAAKSNIFEKLGFGEFQVRGLQALLHDLANPLDTLQGKSETWGLALEDIRKKFGSIIGYTEEAANAQEVLTKFTKEHEAALKRVTDEQARSNEELQKATLGTSFKEIEAQVDGVTESFQLLQTLGLDETGQHADRLRERVAKLDEFLKSLGPSVAKALPPEKLKAFESLRDRLVESTDATEDLVAAQTKQIERAKQIVKGLEEQAAGHKKNQQALEEFSTSANSKLDQLVGKFAALNEAQDPERVADIKAEIIELTDEYDSLGTELVSIGDEEERRTEIQRKLAQLTAELARIQDAAVQDQIDAQAELAVLLGEYEQKLQELPENVRPALQAIIDKWQFQNEQVQLGVRDIETFKTEWVANLSIAESAVAGLSERTQAELVKARDEFQATADAAALAFEEAGLSIDALNLKLDGTISRLAQVRDMAPAVATAFEESI